MIRKFNPLSFNFFHQLDSISKRVEDMRAFASIERRLCDICFKPRGLYLCDQFIEVVHNKSRVRFSRRLEISLHAEMQLRSPSFQPNAAAFG